MEETCTHFTLARPGVMPFCVNHESPPASKLRLETHPEEERPRMPPAGASRRPWVSTITPAPIGCRDAGPPDGQLWNGCRATKSRRRQQRASVCACTLWHSFFAHACAPADGPSQPRPKVANQRRASESERARPMQQEHGTTGPETPSPAVPAQISTGRDGLRDTRW